VTSVRDTLSHRPRPIHPSAAHDINIDTQMPDCRTATGLVLQSRRRRKLIRIRVSLTWFLEEQVVQNIQEDYAAEWTC
jgi:hypothetical protein